MKIYGNKGITLVALVVTIIILIILSSVSISLLVGNNNIINRGEQARFKSDITEIETKVMQYWSEHGAETTLLGTTLTKYEKLPIIVGEGNISTVDTSNFKESLIDEILEISGAENISEVKLYQIDKDKIKYENSHTYILDIDTFQVYDVEGEEISGEMHHTANNL